MQKTAKIETKTLYWELLPALYKEKKTTLAGVAVLGLVGAVALSRVEETRFTRLFVGTAPAPLYFAWAFHQASREKRRQQEGALAYNQGNATPEFKNAIDQALGSTKEDQLLQLTRLRLAGGRKQELLSEWAETAPVLKGIHAQAILDNHPVSRETLSAAYVQRLFAEKGWTKKLSDSVDPEVAVRAIQLLNRFEGSLPVLEYHFSDAGRTAELLEMESPDFRPALELLQGGHAEGDKITSDQRSAAIEDGLFSHITRKIGQNEPKGFNDSADFLTLDSGVRKALFASLWERVGEKGKGKIAREVRFFSSSTDQKLGKTVNPLLLPSEISSLLPSDYSNRVLVDCTLFLRMKGWEIKFFMAGGKEDLFHLALAGLIIDSEGVRDLKLNLTSRSQLRPYANAVQLRLVQDYGMQFEAGEMSVFNALEILKNG